MLASLAELAGHYGVATRYRTDRGEPAEIAADNVRRVLAAFDVDTSSEATIRAALAALRERDHDRLLPGCVVLRQGRPRHDITWRSGATYWVETASGRTLPVIDPARDLADLPIGYHTLRAESGHTSATARLAIAPPKLSTPDTRRWGLLTQLYSVLSPGSWGMGDLADLTELASWSGGLGASFILLNPMHAYVPGALPDPSPYRPGTRRFADPMNLRVEEVPEYRFMEAHSRELVDELARRGRALTDAVLHQGALIDREAVWALKREALELLYRCRQPDLRFTEYMAREGAGLNDYATWCALAEVHGSHWRSWPADLRAPDAPGIAEAQLQLADRIEFHRWLNWVVDSALAQAQTAAREAGMTIGLVHDLAVGVDPEGADAWSLQRYLANGMTIGCPADDFNPHGQDWGLPPWRPDTLAEAGYTPFAEVVRGTLRRCGALRLDHIMGLFRLWWVPQGGKPADGTYVRYDHEALLGVLALEAHLAGSMIIGEDLGTVETGVREELSDRGVLGTSVLRFEYQGGAEHRSGPLPAASWRPGCLATLTTHDLPTTAAWLSGEHVGLYERLGLLTTREAATARASTSSEVDAWLTEMTRCGALSPAADGLAREVLALHRFLAMTPALMIGVWLPDLVGDRRPQNVPGTVDEFPNWRLPVAGPDGRPLSLPDIMAAPGPPQIAGLYRDL